jgi:hypothetical protein
MGRFQRAAVILLGLGGALVWSGLPACGRAAQPRAGLSSPNPLDRARGVVEVAESRDPDAAHKLVDLLEDPDAAVRMYAIIALRRLYGHDHGYRFYQDEGRRAVAVERWRRALRAGQLQLRSDRSAPPAVPRGDGVRASATRTRVTAADGRRQADAP